MLETILHKIPDIIGLFGVGLILIAYYLLSMGKMSPLSIKYQLYNCIGAVAILISLFFTFNLSSFVIEVVWVMISLIGIVRALRKRVIA